MNERTFGADDSSEGDLGTVWLVRLTRWAIDHWRPYLGWLVLFCCIALATLPATLLWENRWLRSESLQANLYLIGPLAVGVMWALLGWRGPAPFGPRWVRPVVVVLLFLSLGAAIIGQLLGGWLPQPGDWQQAIASGQWHTLSEHMAAGIGGIGARYALWWQGVEANSAARDDVVLTGIVAAVIWLCAGATAVLARRYQRGLLAGVPILWPVGFVMLYSPVNRWLFVAGVALTLLLHFLLDQQRLAARWKAAGLDYSPILLLERGMTALAGFALALLMAALIPNLYIHEVSARYYAWLAPMNHNMEAIGKRLFPGLTGVLPWESRGVSGGMPNAFLLGAGPDLGHNEVMRVRTNEPVAGYDSPPPAHRMRGTTFSNYDGHGWSNPAMLDVATHGADQPWAPVDLPGRRPLLQSINLEFQSQVLYAAGEPQTPSVDYAVAVRFPGDLVSLGARTRSYTMLSQVPALDEAQLNALPAWDQAHPLPPEYGLYLALPDTVTARLRELSRQLTADQPTMYGKASAIERYLRQFPYDLTVSAPPKEITDVADYFVFDLKRGYCDYYATSFAVLARLAGLPTRLATGFAPGNWSLNDQAWVITEAEAHSWPEVYFPEVGWVPFEPTAGRPPLVRAGLPAGAELAGAPAPLQPLPPLEDVPWWRYAWWALLVLAPIGLVTYGVFWWRGVHEDPWLALLRWGRRNGRAMAEGETPLEYGIQLGEFVQTQHPNAPEVGRIAARELQALGSDVSGIQYAPETQRGDLQKQALARWERLRGYLSTLRK